MRIAVLAGGIGAARFLRGLRACLADQVPASENHSVTIIGNTADDIRLFGLRVCPDLDSVMYTLGGGADEERGWGRDGETFAVRQELAAYRAGPDWFTLGDKDFATHILRTQMVEAGYPLSAVTAALCRRWTLGTAGVDVRLLPMTDDRVETHVVVDDPDGPGRTAMHFQEWWVRHRAALPPHEFVFAGAEDAQPAPGVLAAVAEADVIVLPPSNPVVSIEPILRIPGIRSAVGAAAAPVVGVSPIIGGAPVRGMADACLAAVGVEVSAAGVARHYGARSKGGLLDAWVIDNADAARVPEVTKLAISCLATATLMTDVAASARLARVALELVA